MVSISDAAKAVNAIAKIAKRIKNYELTEKVADLQGLLMDLLAENTQLKAELTEAQHNSDFANKATLKDGAYWLDGDAVPFCQRCWEVEHNMVHLDKTGYGAYICPEEIYRRELHKSK
ncbi:hypothetical protein [Lacticaseibacillus paracasei]|uniref:hypothetical protein n=1 Tax=Lacticaseibacillus paracasei TaxID=1597 RepID=UPI001C00ABE2|nr:hypothetical protein [Lacticaseibacillus paracasei]MBT9262798.1 hypothetical protein [Lacticaseibacillus paracasei]UWP75596.1 hypothetical protein KZR06_08935 [Lacticaseibacillus paracasei]